MNKEKIVPVVIGLIVAGLLSTLFIHSQINQQQHLKVTRALMEAKENDLMLNKSIINYQTALHKNFDAVSLSKKHILQTQEKLYHYLQDYFITDIAFKNEFDQLIVLENEKFELVTSYKKFAAVNKLTRLYLPKSFSELVSNIERSVYFTDKTKASLTQEVNRLNIRINQYLAGFEHDAETLEAMLTQLRDRITDRQGDTDKKFKLVSQHVRKVIETNNHLLSLIDQIQNIKTVEQIRNIRKHYAVLFETHSNKALKYKTLLFITSIVLLVYLSLVLLRLQSTGRDLKETLTDLKFRKQALNKHAIISITDIQGNIIYVNNKFCEISQYKRDELIGQNNRIIKSNQHSKKFYTELWRTIANGKTWQGQICNQAKDGSFYWVETTLLPRLNEQGDPYEYIGMCTDISAQKSAESEIKSLARFPMEMPEPVMRINHSGDIIFHNKAAKVILKHWHGKLPVQWLHKVQDVLNIVGSQEVELSIGVKQYLLVMTPVIEANYVNIYARDITEKKRAEASLSYQAKHDRLTGLVNRYVFEHDLENALASAQRNNKRHILLYIDLDQFKIVNDTCGHVAGDALLCQLSNLMLSMFRENDTLARLGGDEFGVLLINCELTMGKTIASKLLSTINHYRFIWQGQQFEVGASIGLVEINKHSDSIVSLLGHADIACYAAKDAGRNQIKTYHSEDSESAKRHTEIQWASQIPKALAEDRFCLMVQTILPLKEGKEFKPHYEILLRMVGENGELIPPGVFIPAAERYNLMHAIDHWVVVHVFNFLHDYIRQNGVENLPVLAINLSGESMGSEELLAYIRAQLELKIIPAENICFEVTETAAIGNLNKAILFIESLKKLGCQFALDDFGSGLSSFSYLKSLPVDYLKIDGAFVKGIVDDEVDAAMVEAINQVGHIMKIKTIAEFVENAEIMLVLKGLDIDYAQGYHIDKPIPLIEKFPLIQQRGLEKVS